MPTLTFTIADVDPAVLADLVTVWSTLASPVVGTVPAIDATTTPLTFSVDQSKNSSQQALPAVGQSVLVDSEPMAVTAVTPASGGNPAMITVTRGTLLAPMPAPMASHAAGSALTVLSYYTFYEYFHDDCVRPWSQQKVSSLGAKSKTFGGTVGGSIG
jgi:hypothetical protein